MILSVKYCLDRLEALGYGREWVQCGRVSGPVGMIPVPHDIPASRVIIGYTDCEGDEQIESLLDFYADRLALAERMARQRVPVFRG